VTDFVITDGRAEQYPARHYGAHFTGSRATFCLDADLINPSDNVKAIPGTPVSALATSAVSTGAQFFGAHIKYRINDTQSECAVGTVRSHDMENGKSRWQYIEPSDNVWDFDALDYWVDAHYAAGRDILFTLFGTPTWASARPTEEGAYGPSNLGIQAEPSDMTKWDRFCTKIATRYLGKIKYYEVWNEPNYNNDGTGPTAEGLSSKVFYFSGTFAKLAEMVRRANQAIKAVDPTAKIISPPITAWGTTDQSADSTKAEGYFVGMMAAATGDGSTTMKSWIDIVGVHLYIAGNDITKLPGMIDRVKAGMTTAGISGKEIWDTESAPIAPDVSGMPIHAARRFIIRSLLIQAAKGISRTFYYQYDDATMGVKGMSFLLSERARIIGELRSATVSGASILADGRVVFASSSGQLFL
jgi:hypothetical protein